MDWTWEGYRLALSGARGVESTMRETRTGHHRGGLIETDQDVDRGLAHSIVIDVVDPGLQGIGATTTETSEEGHHQHFEVVIVEISMIVTALKISDVMTAVVIAQVAEEMIEMTRVAGTTEEAEALETEEEMKVQEATEVPTTVTRGKGLHQETTVIQFYTY